MQSITEDPFEVCYFGNCVTKKKLTKNYGKTLDNLNELWISCKGISSSMH